MKGRGFMTNRYIEKTTSNLLNILQTVKRSAYQKRGHSDVTFSFGNEKVELVADVIPEREAGSKVIASLICEDTTLIDESNKNIVKKIKETFNEEDSIFVSY